MSRKTRNSIHKSLDMGENLSACLENMYAQKEFANSKLLPSPLPIAVLEKSSEPYSEAHTPASNPLKRNMEAEYWLNKHGKVILQGRF